MEKIEGSLEHIIYRNEENGYTVGKILETGHANVTTVVGSMMGVQVGETLLCEGYWKNDKKFGKQFVVEAFDVKIPSTTRGIELYLASGSVAGIGAVFAKKIVDHFGEITLEVFDIAPHRLLEIEGIGKKKLERIQSAWAKQKDVRQVMIFLQNYGVSPAYAQRIFKVYGQKSIEKVKENPYRLSTEIDGIGFKKSDAIAQKMGVDVNDAARIASGIEFTLEQVARMGHSCYPLEGVVKEAAMLLGVAFDLVEDALNRLAAKGRVILKLLTHKGGSPKTFVWSKVNYDYEKEIAAEIQRLKVFEDVFEATDLELAIEKSSKKNGITLAVQQEAAVIKSIEDKLHIITGGPGTGKSTITKVVLDICLETTESIVLAAPTGRAAKRLSEITKREASTIHSLLTFDFVTRYFRKNKYDQLDCEVLIVDEASMIDAFLMSALLKAVPDNCKVILVGDVDQLPSVGAGNVLNDLIQSERVPVTRLTEIFRQAINSQIVINAHKINQGIFPNITTEKDSDFFFITERQPERLIQHILGLIDKRLPKAYGLHKLKDIQLLCPMNKGKIGSVEFNRILQLNLNPKKKNEDMGVGHKKLVEGDKVIQTRNNYDKGVYNGDIGYLKKVIDVDKIVVVEFDGKEVEYEFSELLELDLAYAVSVHKYQGSESPCIILPIHESYNRLLFRNLLYTGITRGKQLVILVGTKEAVSAAIRNNKAHKRYTGLVAMLQQEEKGLPIIQIVPMLGAEGYADWVTKHFSENEA
ncbi:ATP-dependent RecD-like DNA helicase [Aureispira sp. CCB-QB1]|uniref:SF1B family DNA helicase RecD2 n=1 Tax=Aureispira sp. CCB-QB1 TaxID=1313421 RepID=UPI000695A86C|nr:ATP-dependent RecD-like DNA helicase [Aureispira sp. CCB-QB1]